MTDLVLELSTFPDFSTFQRSLLSPIIAFRTLSDKQIETITHSLVKKKEKPKEKKPSIFCAQCNQEITSQDAIIAIFGKHKHSYYNPAGIQYEVGCFSNAKGCFNTGQPTLEFTWFPGYTWCYSMCSQCMTHLGWYYQSSQNGFYGLIINRLTSYN